MGLTTTSAKVTDREGCGMAAVAYLGRVQHNLEGKDI